MRKEQISGNLKQASGRIQDAAGALMGNPGAQVRGKARAASGRAESLYGDVLAAIEDTVIEKPLAAIAATAFLGFLIGVRFASRD